VYHSVFGHFSESVLPFPEIREKFLAFFGDKNANATAMCENKVTVAHAILPVMNEMECGKWEEICALCQGMNCFVLFCSCCCWLLLFVVSLRLGHFCRIDFLDYSWVLI
jgi:hypothetical protein